jgi:hypothetical protein
MKYRLNYQEQVFDEIDKAYQYYENEQKGLGSKLLDAIEQAERDIKANPLGYQIKHHPYRTRATWPFPYVLVYEVIEKEIIIYQFFCSLQDPASRFKK